MSPAVVPVPESPEHHGKPIIRIRRKEPAKPVRSPPAQEQGDRPLSDKAPPKSRAEVTRDARSREHAAAPCRPVFERCVESAEEQRGAEIAASHFADHSDTAHERTIEPVMPDVSITRCGALPASAIATSTAQQLRSERGATTAQDGKPSASGVDQHRRPRGLGGAP